MRTLPPLLRYPAYVAGVLLMFSMAAVLGAAAAIAVGWQSGRAEIAPTEPRYAGTATLERGEPQATGKNRGSEAIEASKGSHEEEHEAMSIHRAEDANSRGDYTYISDPSIDGDADAVVLVSLAPDRESTTASYDHNIGVWYTPVAHKWAIFNQDLAAVPAGSTFEVVVPQSSAALVHRASLLNTAGNYTYLDNRLTNGDPEAVLSVTQNWNPGGGRGVYNDHPIGAVYDAKLDKWAIYNRDGASIPEGASFNIGVSTGSSEFAGGR